MAQSRPTYAEIANGLRAAQYAVERSAAVRARYRRRRGLKRRATDLTEARERCERAAPQLRSWLGMVAWGGIKLADELAMKRAMEELRYERRQLTKMLAATT